MGDGLNHFKMQMGQIIAVRRAHSADLLPTAHDGSQRNVADSFKMSIQALHKTAVRKPMQQNHDVSPVRRRFPGINQQPASRGTHRKPLIRILSTNAVQILSGMPAAARGIHGSEPLGGIRKRSVVIPQRGHKHIRQRGLGQFLGSQQNQSVIHGNGSGLRNIHVINIFVRARIRTGGVTGLVPGKRCNHHPGRHQQAQNDAGCRLVNHCSHSICNAPH